jgi:hypothetical protein
MFLVVRLRVYSRNQDQEGENKVITTAPLLSSRLQQNSNPARRAFVVVVQCYTALSQQSNIKPTFDELCGIVVVTLTSQ